MACDGHEDGLQKERTCHTNGRFFIFANAKTMATNLHTPPAPFKPDHLVKKARKAGWLAKAVREAPATASLMARPIATQKDNNGRLEEMYRYTCEGSDKAAYLYTGDFVACCPLSSCRGRGTGVTEVQMTATPVAVCYHVLLYS
jgi:hypothetical protein